MIKSLLVLLALTTTTFASTAEPTPFGSEVRLAIGSPALTETLYKPTASECTGCTVYTQFRYNKNGFWTDWATMSGESAVIYNFVNDNGSSNSNYEPCDTGCSGIGAPTVAINVKLENKEADIDNDCGEVMVPVLCDVRVVSGLFRFSRQWVDSSGGTTDPDCVLDQSDPTFTWIVPCSDSKTWSTAGEAEWTWYEDCQVEWEVECGDISDVVAFEMDFEYTAASCTGSPISDTGYGEIRVNTTECEDSESAHLIRLRNLANN